MEESIITHIKQQDIKSKTKDVATITRNRIAKTLTILSPKEIKIIENNQYIKTAMEG